MLVPLFCLVVERRLLSAAQPIARVFFELACGPSLEWLEWLLGFREDQSGSVEGATAEGFHIVPAFVCHLADAQNQFGVQGQHFVRFLELQETSGFTLTVQEKHGRTLADLHEDFCLGVLDAQERVTYRDSVEINFRHIDNFCVHGWDVEVEGRGVDRCVHLIFFLTVHPMYRLLGTFVAVNKIRPLTIA
jgi:hypothetical protein